VTHVAQSVSAAIALLTVAFAVAIAARFIRIPYTVGLVLAGLAIGLFPNHPAIAMTPDVVMLVFLPALLFAGAWEMPLEELGRNWLPVALLATVGVVLGIAISYGLLVFGAHIDPGEALIFGAVVAATDPVAVIALFRELRVDRRLSTIVEGESLFNDGTTVVAFRTLVLTMAGAAGIHPLEVAGRFVAMTAGGAAVGAGVGFIATMILENVDDYLLEATATTIVAYGSYVLAEAFDVSGIIAVIVAGLVASGIGERTGSRKRTRESVNQFWEYAAFLANSMLFVLIGLAVDLRSLSAIGAAAWWGIAAVLVARAVTVYGMSPVCGLFGRPFSAKWQHILALGGLRGALSMALVLSLPYDFHFRSQLIAMVYAVVLFTLIVQGLSLRPAIAALLPSRESGTMRAAAERQEG
jgi:CPA1 family monovalent cation:H+ antiporter